MYVILQVMECSTLNDNEVHIWFRPLDLGAGSSKLKKLSKVELAKFDQIIHPAKKIEYVTTRVLVREALSHYTNIDLRFNVSHCEGLVACAISSGHKIGLDIELVRDDDDFLDD